MHLVAAAAPPRSGAPRKPSVATGTVAAARQAVYSADERAELALLLAPIFFLAAAVGLGQSMKHTGRLPFGASPPAIEWSRPADPPADSRAVAIRRTALQPVAPQPHAPQLAAAAPPPGISGAGADIAPLAPEARTALAPLPSAVASDAAPVPSVLVAALPEAAAPAIAPELRAPAVVPAEAAGDAREEPPPAPVAARTAGDSGEQSTENKCVAPPQLLARTRQVLPPASVAPADADEFGIALATAARAQSADLVIYNDQYRRIAYPMGDVPSFFGVCTDVIIRAYRTLGIDLQVLVQQSRIGSGDPSIDHRRTDTLRRFFAVHGEALPVSTFAEDYKPGDIVSYYRPQNRRSRSHIAVVAAERGPSGRYMIVHNRGWGVQVEDALFVDQITGHYRFRRMRGQGEQPIAAAPTAAPAPGAASAAAVLPLPLLPLPALAAPAPASAAVPPAAGTTVRVGPARTAKALAPARARPATIPTGIPGKGAAALPRLRAAGIAVSAPKP